MTVNPPAVPELGLCKVQGIVIPPGIPLDPAGPSGAAPPGAGVSPSACSGR